MSPRRVRSPIPLLVAALLAGCAGSGCSRPESAWFEDLQATDAFDRRLAVIALGRDVDALDARRAAALIAAARDVDELVRKTASALVDEAAARRPSLFVDVILAREIPTLRGAIHDSAVRAEAARLVAQHASDADLERLVGVLGDGSAATPRAMTVLATTGIRGLSTLDRALAEDRPIPDGALTGILRICLLQGGPQGYANARALAERRPRAAALLDALIARELEWPGPETGALLAALGDAAGERRGEVVGRLLDRAAGPDGAERRDAVKALERLDPASIPALVAQLGAPAAGGADGAARVAATQRAIEDLHEKASLYEAFLHLAPEDPLHARILQRVATRLGPDLLPQLGRLARGQDPRERLRAAHGFVAFGHEGGENRAELRRLAEDPDPEVARVGRAALERIAGELPASK